MLNIMRKNASSWLIKVVFSIIVIVFVFWGVGSFRERQAQRVAMVNGEAISVEAYGMAYKAAMDNLQKRYGNRLTKEVVDMLQVPQQVINDLVTRELMLQAADDMALRVTNDEVVNAIQRMEAFKEAGIFSNRRYSLLLSREKLSPEQFEASMRDDLTIQKLRAVLSSGLKVTDAEVLEWHRWQNAAMDVHYLLFAPAAQQVPEPDSAMCEAYYAEHKEAYATEPKVKVRYISIRTEDFLADAEITPTEIEEYYDTHPSEFQHEKTVEARHILFRADLDAAPELVAEKKQKAQEVLAMAMAGKDFAELAKTYSEGPTRENGGQLGAFKKGAMVKPFADKAFSMEAGEVSDLVRTRFGWHIIKVEKVNPASTDSLADVTDTIKKKLAHEKAKTRAYERAGVAFEQAMDDEDLEKTAAAMGMTLHETDFFTRKGPTTGIGEPGKFATVAFELMENEISNILTIGENYYLLEKTGTISETIPELAAVQDRVRQDLLEKLKDEKAATDAEAAIEEIREGAEFAAVAADYSLQMQDTGFFKRGESIPEVGRVRAFSEAAFLLSDDNPLVDAAVKTEKGYYVLQHKARQAPGDDTLTEDAAEQLKKQLLSQKEQSFFTAYIQALKADSEVVISENYR